MLEALRMRAATVRLVLACLTLVAGMFLFVFPTRTWWSSRQHVRAAASTLALLEHQNARLQGEIRQLHDDTEIEKLARANFGYVFPGEHPYTAIPAPPTSTTTTTVAPGAAPPGNTASSP
ncbi:MAG: septum formation initiator family protein [Actinobacteria bacterium]|nr:septum formation initiator family protein [Actinomycetota bacterium]